MIIALIAVILAVGVPFWLSRRYVIVTVEGRSMEPGYREGDRLVVRRARGEAVRRGQVVVFRDDLDDSRSQPGGADLPAELPPGVSPWILKRAVAVRGDPVPRLATLEGESRVPRGRLVVMGDNAAHSFDSRHFGYLPADRVLGVVRRVMAAR